MAARSFCLNFISQTPSCFAYNCFLDWLFLSSTRPWTVCSRQWSWTVNLSVCVLAAWPPSYHWIPFNIRKCKMLDIGSRVVFIWTLGLHQLVDGTRKRFRGVDKQQLENICTLQASLWETFKTPAILKRIFGRFAKQFDTHNYRYLHQTNHGICSPRVVSLVRKRHWPPVVGLSPSNGICDWTGIRLERKRSNGWTHSTFTTVGIRSD